MADAASPPFTSTYRVQLHRDFDLDDAAALAGYWRALGIDACYTSPPFQAQPGSMHGYDVVEPNAINPELGGRAAFDRFVAALRAHDLGLLVDIVPNHQAATTGNPAWRAMLAGGAESEAARIFDVDWTSGGKLHWPLLGESVRDEIAAGNLRLEPVDDGSWVLRYFDEALPVAGDVDDPNDVEGVLARQHYQLWQWREGARARNYRRFFDVSTLAGVRVEDDWVFDATHRLIGELVASGAISGLRVDHVDGLADPGRYLERLAALSGGMYTVVEKILAADEALPDSWRAAGTTGYEIATDLLNVLVDPAGRAVLEERWLAEGDGERFPSVERDAKRFVLDTLFEPEWERVRRALERFASAAGESTSAGDLAAALAATTISLRVYRTYLTGRDGEAVPGEDRRRVLEALAGAATDPAATRGALVALRSLLLGEGAFDAEARRARAEFLRVWQQVSGAVMAKGHEDTACYRYPVLLAQAEVGSDPGDPAVDAIARFHRRNVERVTRGERGLNATSTHDTKRSEDVRARLAVLSERPSEFEAALAQWRDGVVTRGEERFVAQTLLGAWPLDHRDLDSFATRVADYLRKALREAKQQTSWLAPDEAHEAAVIGLATRSIADGGKLFFSAFGELAEAVAFHGAINGLAQVAVKMALPGVADIYQGCELWDLSLVDPDNRRPVDFDARRAMLASLDDIDELRRDWKRGGIKLFVTSRGLHARRAHPELFVAGNYRPLSTAGAHAENVLAFARQLGDAWLLAIVPRLTTRLVRPADWPVGAVWHDTHVLLPHGAPRRWRDALTDTEVEADHNAISAATALAELPVTLLIGATP